MQNARPTESWDPQTHFVCAKLCYPDNVRPFEPRARTVVMSPMNSATDEQNFIVQQNKLTTRKNHNNNPANIIIAPLNSIKSSSDLLLMSSRHAHWNENEASRQRESIVSSITWFLAVNQVPVWYKSTTVTTTAQKQKISNVVKLDVFRQQILKTAT